MQSGRGTAWIRSLRSLFGRQRIAVRLIKYFGLTLLVSAGVMTLLFSHFFEENYVGRTQLQMYRGHCRLRILSNWIICGLSRRQIRGSSSMPASSSCGKWRH